MKKFEFRLEPLLKFRKLQEENAQTKAAQANNVYLEEVEIEKQLKEKLQTVFDSFRNSQLTGMTVDQLKRFSCFIDKFNGDLARQTENVRIAEMKRREALQELEEAVKNRKLVDKLKERRFQEYQFDLLNAEQKMLDEIGTQQYYKMQAR